MWEGTQEFWRHEVPIDKGLTPHPISGPGRLSFTFRQYAHRAMHKTPPLCHCNTRTTLKPTFKKNQNFGRYFWACRPRRKQGEYKGCDFFKWDDQEEAREGTGEIQHFGTFVPIAEERRRINPFKQD